MGEELDDQDLELAYREAEQGADGDEHPLVLFERRAQEALGVLLIADGPVDTAGEPIFEVPGGGRNGR